MVNWPVFTAQLLDVSPMVARAPASVVLVNRLRVNGVVAIGGVTTAPDTFSAAHNNAA